MMKAHNHVFHCHVLLFSTYIFIFLRFCKYYESLKNTKSLNLICRTTTGVKRPCQGLLERVPGIGSICMYVQVHENHHDSMI